MLPEDGKGSGNAKPKWKKYQKKIVLRIVFASVLCCFLICQIDKEESMSLTPREMKEDYEYMWEVLEENFPLFEAAERIYGVNWEQVDMEYKEKCEQLPITDLIDYYELLKECLDQFEYVGHLSVATPYIYNYVSSVDSWIVEKYYDKSKKTYAFLQQELERQLAQAGKKVQKSMRSAGVEAIQLCYYHEIPIIKISSFSCPDEEERDAMVQKLTAILRDEQDAKQIVFDLRGNGGGSTSIWEDSILPYLDREIIHMTTYSARINGEINQKMYPIDVDKINTISANEIEKIVIESYDISNGLPDQKMDGLDMDGIHISDLERCDLFLKTEWNVSIAHAEQIGIEPDFRLKGDIVIVIDQDTASSATDMAQVFQAAGLATIVGTENAGGTGGFSLPPSMISFCLPNSGLMVRYEPYYIFREDGECIEFGMKPDFIIEEDENIEWWLWKQEHGLGGE